ncbi:hypothetical protein [Actinoallomurus rhizosphaericola]|uniref:hypothetical protein n=1 Tax=Actinoallomurus rhizosphaericola TaxID=2952536 RepID=UPI0020910CFE|nr:hypothetical protein [Actinoallomurus rhizosphaericola]MCO5993535.1 hypothetical protein [Actinoallomurus rhizosphaericola]
MTRLEISAWSLAGGSACVFALAVVLAGLPWQVAFAAVAVAVMAWSWQGRVADGAAIGAIAWMCVTGFDVHRFGYIGITGSDDVARAVVLVLGAVLVASARAVSDALRRYRRADPVWADFHLHATGLRAVPTVETDLPITVGTQDGARRDGGHLRRPKRETERDG